jgi:ubiquinol-cytochrome c reductase cytochrome b subunit
VLHLSFDVRAGLLMRQMHHWAALIFLAAITAHLARIFFTAAYRRPREINWVVGVTMLALAMMNGFIGYSIVDDLLSGAGLRIAYAILMSVPVVGEWLAFLGLGGVYPSPVAIPRLYSLHIFLVPAAIALLIALHLGLIWRQLHTNYPGPRRTERTIVGSRLWPSYALKSLGLFGLLFGVVAGLGALVQIDPVWVYGPYDPSAILPGAQPDWYLGWVEGAMRLFPSFNLRGRYFVPDVFFPGMLLPALVFLGLYLYPFFDKLVYPDDADSAHNLLRLPCQQPFHTAFGCATLVFLLVLLIAGGDDVIAVATGSSVTGIRVVLQALSLSLPPLVFVIVYWACRRALERRASAQVSVTPDEAVITK